MISLILTTVLFLFLILPTTQAAWWDFLTNCEDGVPPDHDCEITDAICSIDKNYILWCGDFDTDRCREWPFDTQYSAPTCSPVVGFLGDIVWTPCRYCPFGCREELFGPICYDIDPCADWGDACLEGQKRCAGNPFGQFGGITETGEYIPGGYSYVLECGYDDLFGCWSWTAGTTYEECDYGCQDGQCRTYNELLCSECHQLNYMCIGNYRVPCVPKPDKPGCWQWSRNPNDQISCRYGCQNGYCLTEEGGESCHECLPGQWRCVPRYPDWRESCQEDSDGCYRYTGMDRAENCPFGCHEGQCLHDPKLDEILCDPEIACHEGQVRCFGAGDSVIECQYDDSLGCWAWNTGRITRCPSGVCVQGYCAPMTATGYEFNLTLDPNITANIVDLDYSQCGVATGSGSDLTWNDQQSKFVVSGWNATELVSGYWWQENLTYYEYDNHGLFRRRMTITDPTFTTYTNTYYATNLSTAIDYYGGRYYTLWRTNMFSGQEKYEILMLNHNFEVIGKYQIANKPYLGLVGIAVDKNFIYVNELNYGIGIYYTDNGTDTGNQICLAGSTTTCGTLKHQFLEVHEDKLYVTYNNEHQSDCYANGTNEIQVYGVNDTDMGYYYGSFSQSTQDVYLNDGIERLGNEWYILKPYRTSNSDYGTYRSYIEELILEVMYDIHICENECYDGGSQCGGTLNEWVQECVQNEWGCWRYYDGTFETDHEEPERYCGPHGCNEEWYNHKIKVAHCNVEPECVHVCNLTETTCDPANRYVMHCEIGPIDTFWGEVTCRRWEEDIHDWEYCGHNGRCENGRCITDVDDECLEGEWSCLNLGNGTQEFRVPCLFDNYTDSWAWIIQHGEHCPFGCVAQFDVSTNLTYSYCIASSDDIYAIKNIIDEYGQFVNILFPDVFFRGLLILFLMVIVGGVITIGTKEWQMGIMGSLGILIVGLSVGWLPIEILGVFIVGCGFLIYKSVFSNG